ncbi:SOS response-associated peptidase [Phenylobacterium hankyongense]|uniref:Abasic site processing protein n=1 Tax=Phenylobacterium hankyongense TaxID=1813876 RepID=A0A328B4R7_9CAUL|nr:SOS response-associated peptidase [Phenylobacterium hankyongense]RAK60854.1 SOS response-associated peptidase [Phenylobacterium hankyongense]
MCNEYRFKQSLDRITDEFSKLRLPLHWAGGAPNLEPRDSIRPTDPAPVIIGSPDGAELRQLRWGFAQPRGGPVINFRSDGRRFPSGRCLVPADGFYEFTGDKAPKAKWLFTSTEAELFCIAGLVRDDRFTLLTTAPGPDIAPYHDRQIVILPRDQWAAWLGPAQAQPPIRPLPAGSLAVEKIR